MKLNNYQNKEGTKMEVYTLQIVILEPEPELPHVLIFQHPEAAREVYESYLKQLSDKYTYHEYARDEHESSAIVQEKGKASEDDNVCQMIVLSHEKIKEQ